MNAILTARLWRRVVDQASALSAVPAVAPFGFEFIKTPEAVAPKNLRRYYVYAQPHDPNANTKDLAEKYVESLRTAASNERMKLSDFVDRVYIPGDGSPEPAIAAGLRTCVVCVLAVAEASPLDQYLNYLFCAPASTLSGTLLECREAIRSPLCRRYLAQLALVCFDIAEAISEPPLKGHHNAIRAVAASRYKDIPSHGDWSTLFETCIVPLLQELSRAAMGSGLPTVPVAAVDIHGGGRLTSIWGAQQLALARGHLLHRYCTFYG